MAFKTNDGGIKYKICDLNRIVDEKGATFIALRKIQWGVAQDENDQAKPIKLDLRKYYNKEDGETMSKGVSFLTEEGPHELINIMVEEGYGHTTEILSHLIMRDDFKASVNEVVNGVIENSDSDEDFYDPREVLFGA